MAKKTVTVKGTLLVLEYCSQKVMKKLVKAGEYENQANAFSGEFYGDTLWTKVDALYVDEEEKNNLLQNVGTIVRTTDYFHELFSNESTHPLPVELHYRK